MRRPVAHREGSPIIVENVRPRSRSPTLVHSYRTQPPDQSVVVVGNPYEKGDTWRRPAGQYVC